MDYTIKNIDNDYVDISNEQVFQLIQGIIKKEAVEVKELKIPFPEFHLISNSINYITNQELLFTTISTLQDFNWIRFLDEVIDFNKLYNLQLTKEQNTKIFSFITASLLEYECLTKHDESSYKPEFKFLIVDVKSIKFNSNEWYKNYRNNLTRMLSKYLDTLPIQEREKVYNNIIESYNDIHLMSDMDLNKNIDYLRNNFISKQSITVGYQKKKITNTHPDIFKDGVFEIFENWILASKDEPYKKFSFIFQRLKKDEKLRKHSFKDTLEWLYKNEYLNHDTYQVIIIKDNWISPKNILGKEDSHRNTLYQSIIEKTKNY